MTYYSALHYASKSEKSSESAKGYADLAKSYAESINPDNFISKNKITNCITEIPQDIKLELNNGVLTLKAGSKVYIPNGFEADGVTPKFDIVVTTSDMTYSWDSTDTNNLSLYYRQDGGGLIAYATDTDISGGETPSIGNFYNVNTNTIYRINKGQVLSYQLSLPLAHITSGSNMITSIDQIFNGFGYIGSTVFALPNVKGLIPNGRNADGSLKNIEFMLDKVITRTFDTDNYKRVVLGLHIDNSISRVPHKNYYYNEIHNKNTDNGVFWDVLVFGSATITSGEVSDFSRKQTFNMVDYSDSSWIAEQAMPSNRYIDLTLGSSGATYTAPANGYFQISKTGGVAGAQVNFSTPSNKFGALFYSGASTGSYCKGFLPVKKGQEIIIQYSATGATNLFRFIYAEGEI